MDAHIVNTVSGAGLWGNPGQAAYSAAKAGIGALTLVTAMEMQRYGVAVNAISPLAVTRMSASFFGEERAADPELDPACISAVVAWLQSPQASWLTGQILRIDGRRLIRIVGSTEAPHHYVARNGERLEFDELHQAARWLWGTAPRGLAGPLPVRP